MNTTECKTLEKLTDKLLRCKINEQTDEHENPEEYQKAQDELGHHIISCMHPLCVKMTKARTASGIMTAEGDYLL